MSDPLRVMPTLPEQGASTPMGAGRRFLHWLSELLQTLLIAGVLFLIVNQLTARIRVDGDSMEPTLHDGEFVVVSRLAYLRHLPERGDIIVFRYPLDPSRRFIKRVIGVPGDFVVVRAGQVLVNGTPLTEPYIAAAPNYGGEWSVGSDEVFVLGDNRNNSSDSQNWGNLRLEAIIGKAILVYWPPESIGPVPHYELAVAAPE